MYSIVSITLGDPDSFQQDCSKNGHILRIFKCKWTDNDHIDLLGEFEFVSERSTVSDSHISYLDALKSCKKVEIIEKIASFKNRELIVIRIRAPSICQIAKSNRVFCVECAFSKIDYGKIHWEFFVRDAKELGDIITKLKKHFPSLQIMKISPFSNKKALTDRQEEIIAYADSVGYYNFPRIRGLTEIAAHFNIASSSLSEILRRAESKIVEAYLKKLKGHQLEEWRN